MVTSVQDPTDPTNTLVYNDDRMTPTNIQNDASALRAEAVKQRSIANEAAVTGMSPADQLRAQAAQLRADVAANEGRTFWDIGGDVASSTAQAVTQATAGTVTGVATALTADPKEVREGQKTGREQAEALGLSPYAFGGYSTQPVSTTEALMQKEQTKEEVPPEQAQFIGDLNSRAIDASNTVNKFTENIGKVLDSDQRKLQQERYEGAKQTFKDSPEYQNATDAEKIVMDVGFTADALWDNPLLLEDIGNQGLVDLGTSVLGGMGLSKLVKGSGSAGATIAGAVQEGASASNEAVAEISDMSHEQLMESEEYVEALEQTGGDQEAAKDLIIGRASRNAFVGTGLTSAVIGQVSGADKAAGDLAEGATKKLTGRVADVGKETVEESVQSGVGSVTTAAGVRIADEDKSLTEGVGEAIVQGAAGGALASGGIQTPAAIVDGTKKLGEKSSEFFKDTGETDPASDFANAVQEKNPETKEELASNITQELEETIPEAAVEPEAELTPAQQVVKNSIDGYAEMVQDVKDATANGSPEDIASAAYTMFAGVSEIQNAAETNPVYKVISDIITRDGGYLDNIAKVLTPDETSADSIKELYAKGTSTEGDVEGTATKVYKLAQEDKTKVEFLMNQALYSTELPEGQGFTVQELEQLNEVAQSADVGTPAQREAIQSYVQVKKAEEVTEDVVRGTGKRYEGFKPKLQRFKSALQTGDEQAATKARADVERFAQDRIDKAEAYASAKIEAQQTGLPVTLQYKEGVQTLTVYPQTTALDERIQGDATHAGTALEAIADLDSAYNSFNEANRAARAESVVRPQETTDGTTDDTIQADTTDTVGTDSVDSVSEPSDVSTQTEDTTDSEGVDESQPTGQLDLFSGVVEPSLQQEVDDLGDVKPELTDIQKQAITNASGQLELDLAPRALDNLAEPTVTADQLLAENAERLKTNPKSRKLNEVDAKQRSRNFIKQFFRTKDVQKANLDDIAQATSLGDLRAQLASVGIRNEVNTSDGLLMTEDLQNFRDAFNGEFASRIKRKFHSTENNPAERFSTPILGFVDSSGEVKSELIDAMALAAMNFVAYQTNTLAAATNNELKQLLGIDTAAELPDGARGLLGNAGTPEAALVSQLGRDVMDAMGITASANTPINYTASLEDALGIEILDYLEEFNYIRENRIDNGELASIAEDGARIELRETEQDAESGRQYTRFWGLPENLGEYHKKVSERGQKSNRVSQKLVDADKAPKTASFAPINEQADTFIRSSQKISERAKKANKLAQSIPHYVTAENFQIMDGMTQEEFLSLFGLQSEENRNEVILDSIKGKNTQLKRAYEQLNNLRDRIADGGKGLDQQDLYFGYQYTQNYRQQMQSDVSPQGDKLVRSFVNTASTLGWVANPNRSKSHKHVKLAVAQGLGLDPDKNSNKTVLAQVNDILESPTIGDALDMLQAYLAGTGSLDKVMLKDAIDFGGEAEHTFQVLVEYARYRNFMENGKKGDRFRTSLYLELDGVTNGPFNAMVQMGNGDLDQTDLDYLEKGGLFMGMSDKVSFNEVREGNNELDTYNSVASIANTLIPVIMGNLYEDIAKTKNSMKRKVLTHIAGDGLAAINSFLGKHIGDDGKYTRASTKNRVTVTIYGGGKTGNNNKAVSEIVKDIHSNADKFLQQHMAGGLNEDAVVDFINRVNNATKSAKWNKKKGEYDIFNKPFNVKQALKNPEQFFKDFKLESTHIAGINTNYVAVHGKALGDATDAYFAKLNGVKDEMVRSSVIVWGMYNRAFLKEREARRKALVEAGRLAPNADLTKLQLSELQRDLTNASPVYQMLFSDQGNLGTYWSGSEITQSRVASTEKRGLYQAKTTKRNQVRARDIQFGEIGVKVSPMLTISNDGSMQILKYLLDPSGKDGNVFDAILGKVDSLEKSSTAINSAAYLALRDFNQVQSVADTFSRAVATNPILTSTELTDREKGEELIRGLVNDDTIVNKAIKDNKNQTRVIASLVEKNPSLQSMVKPLINDNPEGIVAAVLESGIEFADLYRNIAPMEKNLQTLATKATDRKNALLSNDISFNQMAGLTDGGITTTKGEVTEQLRGSTYEQQNKEYFDVGAYQEAVNGGSYTLQDPVYYEPEVLRKQLAAIKTEKTQALAQIFKKNSDFLSTVAIKRTDKIDPAGQVNGTYTTRDNTVIMKTGLDNAKYQDVLSHELLHAIAANTLQRYYDNPTSLDKQELAAVKSIESMLEGLLSGSVKLPETTAALDRAMTMYAEGNKYGGMQEFIAYGLTDTRSTHVLSLTEPTNNKYISALMDKLRSWLAKMFGVKPSLLTELAESVYALKGAPTVVSPDSNTTTTLYAVEETPFNAMSIFDRFKESTNPRLRGVLQEIQSQILTKLDALPKEYKNVENGEAQLLLDSLSPEVTAAFSDFASGAFQLDDQESLVFKLYAEASKSSLEGNYYNAKPIRRIFDAARKQLKGKLTNEQYSAVFDGTTPYYLANFLALAKVNEGFRKQLQDVIPTPDRATGDIVDRAEFQLGRVLESISSRLRGEKPATNIQLLAKRLNHIKAKKSHALDNATQGLNGFLTKSDDLLKTGVTKLAKAIRGSRFVQETRFQNVAGMLDEAVQSPELVKTAIANTVATTLSKGRKFGTGLSLLNEISGGDRFYKQTLAQKRRKMEAVDASSQTIRDRVPAHLANLFLNTLTPERAKSLTKVLLNTDLASLLDAGLSPETITNMISNHQAHEEIIASLESQINAMPVNQRVKNWYLNQAEHLGKFIATGEVYLENQMPNARVISELKGIDESVPVAIAEQAKPIIDALASVYALHGLDQQDLDTAFKVIQEESTNPDGSAVEALLRKQKQLKAKEAEAVQGDGEYAQTKGYAFDVFDPNRDFRIVRQSQVKDYIKRGYSVGKRHEPDANDISGEALVEVYSTEGGNVGWLQGVLTLIDTNIGGINPFTGKQSRQLAPAYGYSKQANSIAKRKRINSRNIANSPVSRTEPINAMVPTFNTNGDLAGYRYVVPASAKDSYMNRNTEIHNVLGHWEARISEESAGKVYNEELVKSLNDRYRNEDAFFKRSYVKLSARSNNPEIQEVFRLLPNSIKEAQKAATGREVFYIHPAEYDNLIGYRKYSVTQMWQSDKRLPQVAVKLAEATLGKQAATLLRRGERGLQDLVAYVKDWIVIRSVVVPVVNVLSNVMYLHLRGVSLKDIYNNGREGFKAGVDYKRLNAELIKLKQQQYQQDTPEVRAKIAQAEEALRSNPVNPLVEAGLMPSVVEDVEKHQDLFSTKPKFMEKAEALIDKLPQSVADVAKEAIIGKDSKSYGLMNQGTELGDFFAKYALMKHLQEKEGHSQESAMQVSSEAFIDYGALPSRTMQYLNDIGMTHFFKYFIRIQSVIADLIVRQPSRVLMFLVSGGYGIEAASPIDANIMDADLGYKTGVLDLMKGFFSHPLTTLLPA